MGQRESTALPKRSVWPCATQGPFSVVPGAEGLVHALETQLVELRGALRLVLGRTLELEHLLQAKHIDLEGPSRGTQERHASLPGPGLVPEVERGDAHRGRRSTCSRRRACEGPGGVSGCAARRRSAGARDEGRQATWPSVEAVQCKPVEVQVGDKGVERAVKHLKRKMASEGILRELKRRRHYMKPSVRRRKKEAEAARRRRKRVRFDR